QSRIHATSSLDPSARRRRRSRSRGSREPAGAPGGAGCTRTSASGHGRTCVDRIAGPTGQSGQRAGRGMRGMEHGQQDAEPIGTILSGIAALLRELSDQLDLAAARVDEPAGFEARLKKLESWALDAGQDITALQARVDKIESVELDAEQPRPSLAARSTRAERREAAARAGLAAAPSSDGEQDAGGPEASVTGARAALALGAGAVAPETTGAAAEQVSGTDAAAPEEKDEAGAPAALPGPKPRADAPTSAEPASRAGQGGASEPPPRLAPPRLLPPEVPTPATTGADAQTDSGRRDAATDLGPPEGAQAPGRRLPRANFPRRQPRTESGSASGLLGASASMAEAAPTDAARTGAPAADDDAAELPTRTAESRGGRRRAAEEPDASTHDADSRYAAAPATAGADSSDDD